MKKISILVLLLTVGTLFGQTAWSDSGSVYQGLETKEISFSGVVAGGDTLVSLPFDLSGYNEIYSVWSDVSQENDSVYVRVMRESSGLANIWLDSKMVSTISSGASSVYADTLRNIASVRRLKIYGLSLNGYNTNFKLKIIAKKN